MHLNDYGMTIRHLTDGSTKLKTVFGSVVYDANGIRIKEHFDNEIGKLDLFPSAINVQGHQHQKPDINSILRGEATAEDAEVSAENGLEAFFALMSMAIANPDWWDSFISSKIAEEDKEEFDEKCATFAVMVEKFFDENMPDGLTADVNIKFQPK